MDSVKILLVDDNAEERLSVSALLEAEGYIVSSADNNGEALKRIMEEKFDLAVIDPVSDNIKDNDIFPRIKGFIRQKTAPLIVLTSRDETDEIEELFKKGIDDYIVKPPRASHLISRVERYTGRRRSNK